MSITERSGRSVIIWMSIGCAVTRIMEFDDVMDNLKYCYNKRLENLNNTITNLRKW